MTSFGKSCVVMKLEVHVKREKMPRGKVPGSDNAQRASPAKMPVGEKLQEEDVLHSLERGISDDCGRRILLKINYVPLTQMMGQKNHGFRAGCLGIIYSIMWTIMFMSLLSTHHHNRLTVT